MVLAYHKSGNQLDRHINAEEKNRRGSEAPLGLTVQGARVPFQAYRANYEHRDDWKSNKTSTEACEMKTSSLETDNMARQRKLGSRSIS